MGAVTAGHDIADDVNELLSKKNFKELEALARKYEKEKTLSLSGKSALMQFHRGISKLFSGCDATVSTEAEWEEHNKLIEGWITSSPDSINAKLARAFSAIDYAWYARGHGYASTVSDDSLSLFKSRLSLARSQFDALARTAKNNPAWYAGMLDLGLAQGSPAKEFDAWYRKAVELAPYYTSVYSTNVSFHSASWYGDEEEVREAIEDSVKMTKKKLGQSLYARLHSSFSDSQDMFVNGKVDWGRMKVGFEDAVKLDPSDDIRARYARFACVAQDAVSVKKQLDLLGDRASFGKSEYSQNALIYCKALARNIDTGKKPVCFKSADNQGIYCD